MKNTIIAVSGLNDMQGHGYSVEVDEYVPLRFRSYEGTLGIKYVRFGNFKSSLLEFLVDPNSMTVRGFTLTSFDAVHQLRAKAELPSSAGLPIITFASGFVGPVDAQRIDVRAEISVGFGEDLVEIDLGGLSTAQRVVVGGPAEFYVGADGEMVGVRIVRLAKQQLAMLKAQRVE
jgi:hypothetical protein